MIYKKLNNLFKKNFSDIVSRVDNILITSHISPDDDAIGSTLSLKYILSQKYSKKNITVAFTGNPINRFSMFTGFSDIQFVKDISSLVSKYEVIIFLDGSQYSRFSSFPNILINSSVQKICIDHHASPTDDFNLHLQNSSATSTSELIYLLSTNLVTLDKNLCELLLLGILGDTGTFNYIKPSQYQIFPIIKKILEVSHTDIQEFKSKYSTISQSVFDIIKEYIHNTKFVNLSNNQSFQYSFIDKKFINKNKYSDSETSEASHIYMSHFLRLIENYQWGFIATPKNDEISVSFRSLPGSVNVRKIAEELNIGGGHDRAAGSVFKAERFGKKLNLNFVIKYLIDWISSNKLEKNK